MTKDDLDKQSLTPRGRKEAEARCIIAILLKRLGGKTTITAVMIERFDFRTKLVTRRTEAGDYDLWLEEGK